MLKYASIRGGTMRSSKLIICGPCTFSSYDELYKIASLLKERGINYLRAGTFKMRTSPDSFQGLRDEGMEMLLKIKKELGIKIVTELTSIEQVKKYGNKIDIIQIGARNMYNYELLKEVGKTKSKVILKRGLSATYNEWLNAAEYISREGNKNIILCERGIRSFDPETRNVLDLQAVPYIHEHSKYPIIVDPSHASGHSYMVPSMAKAAMAAGADGLLIEVHYNPDESKCDNEQIIDIDTLDKLLNDLGDYYE
jgi:3-deoxy-7-phosphoheptulonate synthase